MPLPYLFIPIETKAREFHAKTLLGCVAAERGFTVIIGKQDNLREALPRLPNGIFLEKSVVPHKAKKFRDYQLMGHRVAAWCEEGLIVQNPDLYIKQRVSSETLKFTDIFVSWGNRQKEAITRNIPEVNDKILPLGNPRIDLYRPRFRELYFGEVTEIRRNYGPFLLINTNFSRYNHFKSREFLFETLKRQGKIRTIEDEDYFWGWSDHVGKIYQAFLKAIPLLSKAFPEWTIIIRPHPSENHNIWKESVQSFNNVKIIHRGDVTPWILASDVVMHNSCTTGLEAYLCDKPVVAFCPDISDPFRSPPLPNQVSRQVFSVEELISVLSEIRENKRIETGIELSSQQKRELVKTYISSLDSDLACDNIVSSLIKLANNATLPEENLKSRFKNRSILLARSIVLKSKKILKKPLFLRVKQEKAYQSQKFPGLSIEEVNNAVMKFKKMTGGFESISVKKHEFADCCFTIFRHSNQ